MRLPNFQSLGTNSSIHIASNNLYKISTVMLISAFRALGRMWSGVAAFPFFKCLIALLTVHVFPVCFQGHAFTANI